MIGYRCKCGDRKASSSMGMPECSGCPKCNTTYASHPDGHEIPKQHTFITRYNPSTGEPYEMCDKCYQRKSELEKNGEIWPAPDKPNEK
jgi:ssDNA-binding Zn-finger/Zn-ribbon topoisomerase 1